MCGIICVLSRKAGRPTPTRDEVLALLAEGSSILSRRDATKVADAARVLAAADTMLKGEPGVRALVGNRELVSGINSAVGEMLPMLSTIEADLEAADDAHAIEESAESIASVKDVLWSLRNDRLRTAREVEALAGGEEAVAVVEGVLRHAVRAAEVAAVHHRDAQVLQRTAERVLRRRCAAQGDEAMFRAAHHR